MPDAIATKTPFFGFNRPSAKVSQGYKGGPRGITDIRLNAGLPAFVKA